jgi:hypothetical protein
MAILLIPSVISLDPSMSTTRNRVSFSLSFPSVVNPSPYRRPLPVCRSDSAFITPPRRSRPPVEFLVRNVTPEIRNTPGRQSSGADRWGSPRIISASNHFEPSTYVLVVCLDMGIYNLLPDPMLSARLLVIQSPSSGRPTMPQRTFSMVLTVTGHPLMLKWMAVLSIDHPPFRPRVKQYADGTIV